MLVKGPFSGAEYATLKILCRCFIHDNDFGPFLWWCSHKNQKPETSNAMWQKSLEIRAIIFVVFLFTYLVWLGAHNRFLSVGTLFCNFIAQMFKQKASSSPIPSNERHKKWGACFKELLLFHNVSLSLALSFYLTLFVCVCVRRCLC